jgi:transposase
MKKAKKPTTKPPRAIGRKPAFDKKKIQELSKYLSRGLSIKDSCQILKVHQATFFRWINDGLKLLDEQASNPRKLTEKEALVCEFCETIKKAQSSWVYDNIEIINKAAPESWQAAAWLLERRDPDQFAKVQRMKTELQGGEGSKGKNFFIMVGNIPEGMTEEFKENE